MMKRQIELVRSRSGTAIGAHPLGALIGGLFCGTTGVVFGWLVSGPGMAYTFSALGAIAGAFAGAALAATATLEYAFARRR